MDPETPQAQGCLAHPCAIPGGPSPHGVCAPQQVAPPPVSPPSSSAAVPSPTGSSGGCPGWLLPLVLPPPPPAEFLEVVKKRERVIHLFAYESALSFTSLLIHVSTHSFLIHVCIHGGFHLFLYMFMFVHLFIPWIICLLNQLLQVSSKN